MFSGLLRMSLCVVLLSAGFAAAPLAADWTRIGPEGGSVDAVAAAPSRPSTLYAGLSSGRVFRSTNGGRSWVRVSVLASEHSFVDLVVDPLLPARVFAATTEGLFRSTDGAETWVRIDPDLEETPPLVSTALAVHPRRPAILLSAFGSLGSLYRSTDRGRTWTQQAAWPKGVRALESVPGEPDTFWAVTWNGQIYRTRDAGVTWRGAARGLPVGRQVQTLAADPRSGQTAYASIYGQPGTPHGIYKTTDGGASWRQIRPLLAARLIVDAQGVVYGAFDDESFSRSADGGSTWRRVGTGLRGKVTDLETLPTGLLAGTEAGVFQSTDRAVTWRGLNQGIAELFVAGLTIDDQDPPRLYAGDPLAGVFKTANRGESWLPLGHPSPRNSIPWDLPLAVSPADPEVVYAGMAESVAKSTNGGRRWKVHGGLVCVVTSRLLIDPREPSTLYASGGFFTSGCGLLPNACTLWRSLDAGESWECTREGLPGSGGGFLGIDPFTSAVYVAAAPQDLWKSTDRGNTWTLVYAGLNPFSALVASARAQGTYYVGRQGEVGRSRDSGQTWSFFSTGLPDQSFVRLLALDPTNDDVLYAGLDEGVFKSTDAGETWSPVGTWPDVRLTALVVDPREPSILYAGTDGEGVLRYEP